MSEQWAMILAIPAIPLAFALGAAITYAVIKAIDPDAFR